MTALSSLPSPEAVEVEALPENLPNTLAIALEYWQKVKGDAFAPSLETFKLLDLPPKSISQTIIVDLHEPNVYDSAHAKFRFFGTLWVETSAQEVTGKTVDQFLPQSVHTMLSDQYKRLLAVRRPLAFKNILPTPKGLVSRFTILRLPISSDGENVTHVASVCEFEENREALQETFEQHVAGGEAP